MNPRSTAFPPTLRSRRLHRPMTSRPDVRSRGQATTEYALILLVAGVIALLVLGWATSGGGGGRIGDLFDTVIDSVISRSSSPS